MDPRYNLLVLLLFFLLPLYGQEHDHATGYHEHHRNEIGIANAPVYFINENVFAYGLHLHYVRTLDESKFGVGLGYERVFDEHGHNTFGLVGSYRPIEEWTINVSPGFTFEDEADARINFALHLETSWEFEVKHLHIGPAFEFAWDPEDYHIALGLHFGFGF